MPKRGESLPQKVINDLTSADLIIHAGDWQTKEVLNQISSHGEVEGVFGNVDDEDIRNLLPEKRILHLKGYKIGVIHGHGENKTTEKRVIEAFEGEDLDCIIFGHSHLPLIRWVKKTLLFNPGSLMDKRKLPFYSYGIIHLHDELRCEHVYFGDKG